MYANPIKKEHLYGEWVQLVSFPKRKKKNCGVFRRVSCYVLLPPSGETTVKRHHHSDL